MNREIDSSSVNLLWSWVSAASQSSMVEDQVLIQLSHISSDEEILNHERADSGYGWDATKRIQGEAAITDQPA